jgi:replicative DNA helicase
MDENRSTTPGGNDASLRVPPHDLHAEQAVIASILLNNDLINGVMEVLRPGDFYQGAHRILYEAMVDLYDRGRPIDQLTLSAVLKDRNAEQQVGGLAYLSEIVTSVPISDNVVHYARIVKEKSILRKTIAAAQEITTAAFQGVADFAIAEEKIKPSYYVMGEMAREAMKEIEEAYERKERITGVASGFRDLDQVTAGFQRSNMIVVAARPGMGKTSLCLNIAVNAAIRQKLPVAIFSLEMSRQELAMRMICSEARVNFQRLRTGHLAQEEVNRLVAAVGKLSEAPIYTDDSGTLSAMELRAKARRLKKERGIGMIIVDYLQLMHGSNTRQNSENRVQEVSEISRSMKSLAKELNIPVVAVSQLSRGVESRNDKRPQMADLRECVTGTGRETGRRVGHVAGRTHRPGEERLRLVGGREAGDARHPRERPHDPGDSGAPVVRCGRMDTGRGVEARRLPRRCPRGAMVGTSGDGCGVWNLYWRGFPFQPCFISQGCGGACGGIGRQPSRMLERRRSVLRSHCRSSVGRGGRSLRPDRPGAVIVACRRHREPQFGGDRAG